MTDTKDPGNIAEATLDPISGTVGSHPPAPTREQSQGKVEQDLESAKDAMRNTAERLEAVERAVHPEDSNRDGR